jgi:DNA-binding CsgD family transcriptional regulator
MTDSAIYYQRLALNLALQYADTILYARIYESLGSVFEDLSMFDSAYMYFSKANTMYELLGNPVEQIEVINNIGDVYRKTGRVAEGLVFTRKAVQLANNYNNLYQLNAAYKDMGKAFELLRRFDSAYYYMDESREVMQQLYTVENTTKMALMQAIFDTERKDAEIYKLLQNKKNNHLILFAGSVVFILLLFLFYAVYTRQKAMMENQLQLRKHKDIIYQKEKSLINAELRNKELQEEKLNKELALRSRELSSQLLHLVQKNQLLEEIKTAVTQIIKDEKRDQKKQLKGLLQRIQESYSGDQYWEEFRGVFDQLHESFFVRLQQKSPELTPTDIRIISLIKMNLTPMEISTLLGITPDSLRVSRYRIKKKLQLTPEESLSGFLQSL